MSGALEESLPLLDLSTRILDVQARISSQIPEFPVLNYEQTLMKVSIIKRVNVQPIDILTVLVSQVEFLFETVEDLQARNMDTDLNHLMSQKAIADCNMLRASLSNSVSSESLISHRRT